MGGGRMAAWMGGGWVGGCGCKGPLARVDCPPSYSSPPNPPACPLTKPWPQVKDPLVLKAGAQVMCTANLVQGLLVNGSRGVVVGFVDARCVAAA